MTTAGYFSYGCFSYVEVVMSRCRQYEVLKMLSCQDICRVLSVVSYLTVWSCSYVMGLLSR